MSLSAKIKDLPLICGVLLSFDTNFSPLSSAEYLQSFFDTDVTDPDIEFVYTTKSKTRFQETSQTTRSGVEYSQNLTISMPIGSVKRSIYIDKVHRVQQVVIKLTNGRHLILGRNDVKTNTAPKISYKADERIAVFQFKAKSMFPMGYTDLESLLGFPFIIPVNT